MDYAHTHTTNDGDDDSDSKRIKYTPRPSLEGRQLIGCSLRSTKSPQSQHFKRHTQYILFICGEAESAWHSEESCYFMVECV